MVPLNELGEVSVVSPAKIALVASLLVNRRRAKLRVRPDLINDRSVAILSLAVR
jgi:hypothetical protein